MIEQAQELYIQAIGKLGVFTQGEFSGYSSRDDRDLKFQVRAVASEHIDPKLYTVLQPNMIITLTMYPWKAIEFTLDPTDFSSVGRRVPDDEGKQIGWFSRVVLREKPKLTADKDELGYILTNFTASTPTLEFSRQVNEREAQLRQAKQVRLAEQKVRIDKEVEEARIQVVERKAVLILENVALIEGQKCLGIIIDDDNNKRKHLRENYDHVKTGLDYSIFFEEVAIPEEAIRLILAIQKLNIGDNAIPVVVFMDGNLKDAQGKHTTGVQTTDSLKAKLDELGLLMPYLVGNSGETSKNTNLGLKYSDKYLAANDYRQPPIKLFQDIERVFQPQQ